MRLQHGRGSERESLSFHFVLTTKIRQFKEQSMRASGSFLFSFGWNCFVHIDRMNVNGLVVLLFLIIYFHTSEPSVAFLTYRSMFFEMFRFYFRRLTNCFELSSEWRRKWNCSRRRYLVLRVSCFSFIDALELSYNFGHPHAIESNWSNLFIIGSVAHLITITPLQNVKTEGEDDSMILLKKKRILLLVECMPEHRISSSHAVTTLHVVLCTISRQRVRYAIPRIEFRLNAVPQRLFVSRMSEKNIFFINLWSIRSLRVSALIYALFHFIFINGRMNFKSDRHRVCKMQNVSIHPCGDKGYLDSYDSEQKYSCGSRTPEISPNRFEH